MPVRWKILHDKRLVTVSTEGVVQLKAFEDYLDNLFLAGALGYPKLVDLTPAREFRLSDADFMMLAARIRAYPELHKLGPVALVAGTEQARTAATLYRNLARDERPIRVFATEARARLWLAQPISRDHIRPSQRSPSARG